MLYSELNEVCGSYVWILKWVNFHCNEFSLICILNFPNIWFLQKSENQLFLKFWLVGTWLFPYWCHQRAETLLKNVSQLNIQWGKKLGFQLSHTQPPNNEYEITKVYSEFCQTSKIECFTKELTAFSCWTFSQNTPS